MAATTTGRGDWCAWWKSADQSDYQRQYFATEDEAQQWAARWRKTNARGETTGVFFDGDQPIPTTR